MLRKTQSIAAAKAERDVAAMRADLERAFTPAPEFRDPTAMPAEIDRAFSNNRGEPRRNEFQMRSGGLLGMKPSRIMLLMVAIVAGGVAAYLTLQREPPAVQTVTETKEITEVVPEARTQILVAANTIGIGQRLSEASLVWADWPVGAVRPEYITNEAVPDAVTGMSGAIARVEFAAGEPIREEKVTRGDGYLSAVLQDGMRAVSVMIAAESASGGFVVPGDHVDVVVTRVAEATQVSDTILTNVRVLAINQSVGATNTEEQTIEAFTSNAIATLELDSSQAEVIISASTLGKLTLVLRAMGDTAEMSPVKELSANQRIRMTSPFWKR